MILRNFLYLDTSILNDYLSTIEGFIEEGPIDQTEVQTKQKSGTANIKFVEGNLQSETSTETTQKLARTDASKFNKLYNLLSKNEMSQFLDAFDNEIWSQIRRGEILEIPAIINISKVFKLTQDVQNIPHMIDIMRAMGHDPFENEQEAKMFTGINTLGEFAGNQSIPIIFESEATKGYTFVAQLQRQYLKSEILNLEGGADIIGKVQRIIPRGKQEEIFSLIPAFDSFQSSINREQRRKMQNDKKSNNISEIIKGPAILITPLALYR